MNTEFASTDWLEPIKARLAAATPGTWRHEPVTANSNIVPLHLEPKDWHIVTDHPGKQDLVVGLESYDGAFLVLTTKNGEFIANASSDVKRLIDALEEPVWIVAYGDTAYLVRGKTVLGSYWEEEVNFAIVDHIARQLTHRVRHADGSRLFRDRLGDEPDSEGVLLSEWLTSEGAMLLEPYEMPLEDQP